MPPENPDLSGLRAMMEEVADEKRQTSPKARAEQSVPQGANQGDLLVWNGSVWTVLAKPAGLAVLVADTNGQPTWLTATAKGALIGDGTDLGWLSSIGHARYEYLSLDANAIPEWFT
jgi:hypothetical protein